MKWASVRRTLLSPLSRFKHSAKSSCDSARAGAHAEGGDKKRSQFRQNETDAGWVRQRSSWARRQDRDVHCLGIPSVMSTLAMIDEVVIVHDADS
jgi:hypothetical protein